MPESHSHLTRGRLVASVALAWAATIGFDLLLHAGILARLYADPHPFLLPPERMFRLIPLGYLSFLLITVLLAWLMARLRLTGFRPGAVFGLKLGALAWGAFTLGLASVSTAEPALLLGWFLGQTVEATLAGAVIGAAYAARRLRWLVVGVVALVIGCIVLTAVLQFTGLAPAAEIRS